MFSYLQNAVRMDANQLMLMINSEKPLSCIISSYPKTHAFTHTIRTIPIVKLHRSGEIFFFGG
jgi:hypothetical protein